MSGLAPLLLVASLAGWWGWEKSKRTTHPVEEGYRPELQFPFEAEFELYHNALSLCSMKTRLCLAELGIAYKSHHIDLIETGRYENIRPELLGVNPAGTVPVLLHNGHPVYESHLQIRYAAEHAPVGSPRLVPETVELREQMNRWVDLSSLTENPIEHGERSAGNTIPGLTVPLFASMIESIPYHRIAEGFLFHFDKRRPLVFCVLKARGLANLHRIGPAMQVVGHSRAQMHGHLDALEEQLRNSGGPWILGSTFSLADVSWLVVFERLAQADYLGVFTGDRRPGCSAYWQRLRERPSYRSAIVEHSHPTIELGTRRLQQAKAADPALKRALEEA